MRILYDDERIKQAQRDAIELFKNWKAEPHKKKLARRVLHSSYPDVQAEMSVKAVHQALNDGRTLNYLCSSFSSERERHIRKTMRILAASAMYEADRRGLYDALRLYTVRCNNFYLVWRKRAEQFAKDWVEQHPDEKLSDDNFYVFSRRFYDLEPEMDAYFRKNKWETQMENRAQQARDMKLILRDPKAYIAAHKKV